MSVSVSLGLLKSISSRSLFYLPTRRLLKARHGDCFKQRFRQCSNSSSNNLLQSICKYIKYSGPISISQYMKEVLRNPVSGYYIHGDMLGSHGDFITSPELNQMFGELISIWFISEWTALGSPKSLQFVELGPGRGSLCDDILRTFKHFEKILKNVTMSFHFVEVSKTLSNIQYQKLCDPNSNGIRKSPDDEAFMSGTGKKTGTPMYWHRSIESIPKDCFTFFLAHEFFDALPIHKFVKSDKGWREIFVDLNPESENELRLVQLPEATLASTTLIKEGETREHIEVCPEGGAIVTKIAQQIENKGGACLIIDYGHDGDKEDTLRGFKNHRLNDIFQHVGEADLTADVDFNFLSNTASQFYCEKSGPISQQAFLKNMGIELRLMMLLQKCGDFEERKKLADSYKFIVHEDHMGERFKFLALTSKMRTDDSAVTGFYSET